MEKWIANNQQKIFLLCAIFTMWCFYSVVHQGGSIIPRIQGLEEKAKGLEESFMYNIGKLESELTAHEATIHYGRKTNANSNFR